MTLVTAQRQDWLADRVVENPALKSVPQAEWRRTLDAVLARLGSAGKKAAQ